MFSIIVPSRNEEYLVTTIDYLMSKSTNDVPIEIIVILDGWDKHQEILDQFKHEVQFRKDMQGVVRVIENKQPVGQRVAINNAIKQCKYDWHVKVDAHSVFNFRWNRQLRDMILEGSVNSQTLYTTRVDALDPECFYTKPKKGMYSYIENVSLKSQWWHGNPHHDDTKAIQDTMSIMGMVWICNNKHWDKIKYDESLSPWGYSGTELSCNSWSQGYKVRVIKNILHGHLFRGSFPYSMTGGPVNETKRHIQNKYGDFIKELARKFSPVPSWQ